MGFVAFLVGIGVLVYVANESPGEFAMGLALLVLIPPLRYVALAIWDLLPSIHPLFKTGIEILVLLVVPVLAVLMVSALLENVEQKSKFQKDFSAIVGLFLGAMIAAYFTFGYVYVPSSTYSSELWWMDTVWASAIIMLYAAVFGTCAYWIRRRAIQLILEDAGKAEAV